MTEKIAGLVLAGGASRRMGGGDKCFMSLGSERLIDRAVARLRPQVGPLAISANSDPALFDGLDLPILPDTPPAGRGPLAGILAGLEWAANAQASHLATIASDTPFFPADLVMQLRQTARDAGAIVLASSRGRRHAVFGLWPVSELEPLRDWLEAGHSLKVRDYVDGRQNQRCEFADTEETDPFFNINTPQDLAEAQRLARAAR